MLISSSFCLLFSPMMLFHRIGISRFSKQSAISSQPVIPSFHVDPGPFSLLPLPGDVLSLTLPPFPPFISHFFSSVTMLPPAPSNLILLPFSASPYFVATLRTLFPVPYFPPNFFPCPFSLHPHVSSLCPLFLSRSWFPFLFRRVLFTRFLRGQFMFSSLLHHLPRDFFLFAVENSVAFFPLF